jgi:PKD repeat protein
MRKLLLTCAIIAGTFIQASAQCLMYPVLLSQRVPQSALVIEGRVVDKNCFWNSAHDKIYTSNLIEVYKTFKNTSVPYIEVITEGGIVGNAKHVFEPTLELEVGQVGVFTLNANNQPAQFGKPVYEAYASAQGFIKYDAENNSAAEPFNVYQNASSTLYNTITQYTGANYVQVKAVNPFQASASHGNSVQNTAAITSFSPTTITAGTFSVLTINGSGFGAVSTPSLIGFKNADDGGATTISPVANEIVSWSATQIQVKVPSKAGTGVIRVNGVNSSGVLTIPYSHLNVNSSGIIYNTKHINQSGGGYIWTYNTNFNTNAPAKAAFQRSLQSWRCATYINWPTASTTSTISASANDGVNIVTFNSALGAGILGQCGSYFSGCGTNPNQSWFVAELDIQFANTPGGGTWQYGTAAPSGSQYDFESVTVHELGHGHQLGHVIKTIDLMHYALSNGQSKRNLNTDDLNGGLSVMVRNAQAGGTCSLPLMTPLTSSNCALGSPVALFSANRTVVCPTQTVAFTDMSTGSPTSWAWTFAGGTPATSSVQNPTVTYNTPGTYSVQLIASNTNGSSTYSVAAYINVTSPAAIPLIQDFQSAAFAPANWYVNDAGNDNVTWKLATTAGYSSTQSALFDNYNDSINNRDELKTYVNLGGYSSAKMTFYRSYSQTFTSPYIDTLQIGVSTNCGSTLTSAYLKGGSQFTTAVSGNPNAVFTPTSITQWKKDSIDLTPYVGQSNVMIAFINRGHYGDGIYIDNINITGVAATTPTAAITSASTGCTGQAITLTDASTGGPTAWAWAMPGGTPALATTQNASVTYSTAGVKSITLTVSNTTGTTTAVKSITITATPTVVASITNTTICSGSMITQNLTGASSYTWVPAGSGASSTLSPASSTVYTVTGSTSGCSSAAKNFTVNVTPTPTTGVTATSTTLCAGQTVTLTASGGVNYAWQPGTMTTTMVAVTPTATTVYTVTGINGSCSSTKTISINVTSLPSITVTPSNTTICSGSCTSLSATGASSYTWNPGVVSGFSISVCPTSMTIYTVTGSNGTCSSTKTATVNVTATPAVNVTASSASICAGQSTTLTASGASIYSWQPGAMTTTIVAVTPTATTVYTVTGFNGSCGSTKTISINVTSTPTVAASVTSTNICSGVPVIVSVTGASAYTWSPTGAGNTSTLSPSSTTIYTVTGSNGSCTGTPVNFTINVTPTPTTGVTATSTNICSGQTVTLTASGGVNYAWQPGAFTTTMVVVSPTATTVYTVTGINGACSSTQTISINVNSTPSIFASVTNTTICEGSSAMVSVTGAGTYTWQPAGSGNTSVLSPTTTTVYTVTGANGNCSSAPVNFTITVNASPVVSTSVTNMSCFGVCDGAMTVTATGGTAPYAYSLLQGVPVCAATTCTSLCAGTYTMKVTGADGCSTDTPITVTQPTQVVATITGTNATCGSCADGATNVTTTGGTNSYNWMWSNGVTTPNNPNLLPGCYTVTVTDMNGCSDTKSTCITFSTKIDELTNSNLSIYPNPSNGIFIISNTKHTDKLEVVVTNALGQTVVNETAKNVSELQIDLGKMSKGIYYLKATTDEGSKLVKLILE